MIWKFISSPQSGQGIDKCINCDGKTILLRDVVLDHERRAALQKADVYWCTSCGTIQYQAINGVEWFIPVGVAAAKEGE